MVSLAKTMLATGAEVRVGDMRDLKQIEPASVAAALSFFALHHLEPVEIVPTLQEWRRVLHPHGQLLVAAWEGSGPIDYGDAAEVVALRYGETELRRWVHDAGFAADRCAVAAVEGFLMDAVYLEATRA